MKTYEVGFRVEGHITYVIEADSPEEAEAAAEHKLDCGDLDFEIVDTAEVIEVDE